MVRLPSMTVTPTQRSALLALAARSIEYGLEAGSLGPLDTPVELADVARPGASFVTLRIARALRGCCGSIEARRALAEDVWRNAWASAFADPRFPALTREEYTRAHLHIAVLDELEPVFVTSELELCGLLRPNIDGLVLELGHARATFLPAVWQQLPTPIAFVRELKIKAGLDPQLWHQDIRLWRYAVEEFGEPASLEP